MKTTMLILSGGIGSRMNDANGYPKQYMEVKNKPIIKYCMDTFYEMEGINYIVIVADVKWHEYIMENVVEKESDKFKGFALPGKTRQLSIYNGLKYIKEKCSDTQKVIIHDAARPLVPKELVEQCIAKLDNANAVMPVLPVNDTYYQSKDGKMVSNLLPRNELFAGQAPEGFKFTEYLSLHEKNSEEYISCINGSSELAFKNGIDVALIPGSEKNFKVTTQKDLKLLEKYLEEEK